MVASRKYFEICVATIKRRVNLEPSKELKPNKHMTLKQAQEIAAKLPVFIQAGDVYYTVTLRGDDGKITREEKFETYNHTFEEVVEEVMEWEECQ